MKTKEEFIKGLSKVKLIIGNGFDLHCHMKTSYKDYFTSDEGKNKYLKSWIKNYYEGLDYYLDYESNSFIYFFPKFENFDKCCIWDFFFHLNSKKIDSYDEWRWCDIEKSMLQGLKDYDKSIDCDTPNWKDVYDIICDIPKPGSLNKKLTLLASVAFRKNHNQYFSNIDEFYILLLNELKIFEKNFGRYIYYLHYDTISESFNVINPRTRFKLFADLSIKELCNPETITSIDSFNYDDLENDEYNSKLLNINGNYFYPIFGIDSNAFPASDIRYIFSKTNRRMELDMLNDESRKNEPYENVVIYGHSLNEADYSYFFSIFDKLQIYDLTNDSKIVFAFSIYDNKNEQKIMSDFRSAISKMFSDYSIYLGKDNQPNRLLDALTSQGKILMYKVKELS